MKILIGKYDWNMLHNMWTQICSNMEEKISVLKNIWIRVDGPKESSQPLALRPVSRKSRKVFGPKSHFKNCDPLILKSWSFTMISRYERANLLQNFMPGNVFLFEIRRKLWHLKCARKVSGVSRNACQQTRPLALVSCRLKRLTFSCTLQQPLSKLSCLTI